MKNYATRRMWVKRSKKSWVALNWLVYKIFRLPIKIVFSTSKFVYDFWDEMGTIFTIFVGLVLWTAGVIVWKVAYLIFIGSSIATPEQILEVRRADSCQDYTLIKRAEQKNKPILVMDLDGVVSDCKKYWADLGNKKQQEEALKNQLKASKP